MFSRKPGPPQDTGALPTPQHDPGRPLEERIVACQDCKHLLYKKDAQEVRVGICPYFTVTGWRGSSEWFFYYCPDHRKSYDYVEHDKAINNGAPRYYRTIPASPARMEPVPQEEDDRGCT